MNAALIWSIAALTIAGILFRPKEWPEAVWACLGAGLLVASRAIPVSAAASAVAKGADVYLFLAGMMLLADLARREGVFDWMAGIAVLTSRGSGARLFALVYAVGIAVTVFLSNDATAVVLTPAVYAAVKRSRVEAQPYLFACAFIANAASFVLPISNPANLVVYGRTLPPLAAWLRTFFVPSVISIAVTFVALRFLFRKSLRAFASTREIGPALSGPGRRAAWGIAGTAAALITASTMGRDLGLPTFIAAICAVVIAMRANLRAFGQLLRGVSWSVLPLVAGLFVLVEAMNRAGAGRELQQAIRTLEGMPAWSGALAASFGVAALSNAMNNLPAGLLAGSALQAAHVPAHLRDAVLIGIDLGPNLSVTGSLATVLWLIALRREGERVSGWTFLKTGVVAMPAALLLATLAIR